MLQDQMSRANESIYAYILVDVETQEILDGNQLARSFFKKEGRYSLLDDIVQLEDKQCSLQEVLVSLEIEQTTSLQNVTSLTVDGGQMLCHVELCRLSKQLAFFVLREDSRKGDAEINQIMELFDNPIFVLSNNEDFSFSFANQRCFQCLRMAKETVQGDNPVSFLSVFPREKQIVFYQIVNHQLDLHGEVDTDIEISFEDGFYQLFRFNAFKSIYDGKLYGVLISAKKQSELLKKIEYDQQYFDIMQQFSKDLLFRIDVFKRTLVHRGDISKFVGLLPEMENFPECMRNTRLIHPEDLEGYIAFVYRLMSGDAASFETRFHFIDGTFEKYRLQASPLFDGEGRVVQVVGKSENIQKYVEIETKANYDALTTALNKHSFQEVMEHNLERAVVSDKFALLFLDLDNFKGINDTFGHSFGDFLLEATSKRVRNCIRSQDRLGRVGGDEFVVFFQFAPSHEAVQERADAILHSLRRDFTLGEQRCKMKASVGIALFPEHGTTYEQLYNRADKALYESKARGKDVATIYFKELDEK